jgi:hypothetical protein
VATKLWPLLGIRGQVKGLGWEEEEGFLILERLLDYWNK